MDLLTQALLATGSALLKPRSQGGGFAAVGDAALQAQTGYQQSQLRKLYLDAQIQQMEALAGERRTKANALKGESERKARAQQIVNGWMGGAPVDSARQAFDVMPGSAVPTNADGMRSRHPILPAGAEADYLSKMLAQKQMRPARQNQGMPPQVIAAYKDLGYSAEEIRMMATADKLGAPEVARVEEFAGPDGSPMRQQFDKYGNKVGEAFRKPVEMAVMGQGDRNTLLNKFNGQTGASFGINQSPDSKASNAVTVRGQNLTNAREMEKIQLERDFPRMHVEATNDGTMYIDERGRVPARPVIGPDGKPLAGKPLTEGQAAAAGYADRMTAAEQVMDKVGPIGNAGYLSAIGGGVPLVGATTQRWLSTEAQEQVKQAQDDWIRAKLRRESGAVIGADEMEAERRTYFPQPGESAAIVAQKKAARDTASRSMVRMAGTGYKPEAPKQVDDKPAPSSMKRGTVIRDNQTGQRYRNTGSGWEPIQ